MNNFDSIPLTKKNKRKISTFVAGELLYDYIYGLLDKSRENAVKESLRSDSQVQKKYKKLISSINYLEELSQTEVPIEFRERIMKSSGYFEKLIEKMKYDQWPKPFKIGLETTLVVFMMACVLTITPWERVAIWLHHTNQQEVILAEIVKQKNLIESVAEIENKQDTSVAPFVDEGLRAPTKTESISEVKNQWRTPAGVPHENQKINLAQGDSHEKLPIPTSSPSTLTTGPGFLYRGDLKVTNVEVVGTKIAEAIKNLGGRKAGNVEIGWKKSSRSRYFHFVIPEAKYPQLLDLISQYGSIEFRKEKHSRLMPEGIIRIIMNMDEKKNDTK